MELIPDLLSLLQDIIGDAQRRVPESSGASPSIAEVMERMGTEKAEEWKTKGVPPGVIDSALKWARAESEGWAKRFPPEKRDERIAEVYPSFLRDAEEKYIKSVLRAMYGPDRKAAR